MNTPQSGPTIFVLAGPNGAGKSSVAGEVLFRSGVNFYNPDIAARAAMDADPDLTSYDGNAWAWDDMVNRLADALETRQFFAFETTLGGNTITRMLIEGATAGVRISVWFVALANADLHVERVRERVAAGGHDIAEEKIRERYDKSREHIIDLMPHLAELKVFDNSAPIPSERAVARPMLVLHVKDGRIVEMAPAELVPDWAKPIVASARA